MLLIAVVTGVAALVSSFCSLAEAAFYSIPPSKIEELRTSGDAAGRRLAKLRENVDQSIAAILTLNTIANSGGAAFAGYLVGTEFGNLWVGVYSGLFTLLVLVFGEIIPKTIGVTHAVRLAPALSLPLLLMVKTLFPFVWLSQVLTSRLRAGGPPGGGAPSEKEILALAEMGARAGTLLPEEARLAMNALKLNDITARDLMTPRTVVYLLPADLPLSMVTKHSEHWSYSRLPVVANNNPDQVEGIVYRREVFDMLVKLSKEEIGRKTLRDLMHPVIFVPDSIRCNELLRRFLADRQHLIVVTNEFGGMEGVISLEDVMEFILGQEIVDFHDKHTDMQEFARRQAERRMRRIRAREDTSDLGLDDDSHVKFSAD